jgi:hypothetical protein
VICSWSSTGIINIKARKMRWQEHVERMGKKNVYKLLVIRQRERDH